MPGNPKFSKDFDGKAFLNVLEVFDKCLEWPNDSEKYFGFVLDECCELVHIINSLCSRHSEYLWFGALVRNSQNLGKNSNAMFHCHTNLILEGQLGIFSFSTDKCI